MQGAVLVVEDFQKPVDPVPAPACRKCAAEMRWYRASLHGSEHRILVHYFNCERCGEIASVARAMEKRAHASAPVFLTSDAVAGERTVWLAPQASPERKKG